MILIDFIKNFFRKNKKKLDNKFLPSQGLFYNDDFEIIIKKVDIKEIKEYENGYDPEDLGIILSKLKKVVKDNIILSGSYEFEDIKSIDVIFIFLEIVSLTKGKPIVLEYFNEETELIDKINFNEKTFNYFKFDDDLINCYDSKEKCFFINGYKFTLPSIGLENTLTKYLINKSRDEDASKYNEYNYNFTYFLGDKKKMTFAEIDNIIEIFNFDMDEDEIKKTNDVVKRFIPLQRYSLIKNGREIEISSKINLKDIWK